MRDLADLKPAEGRFGYHNPERGDDRLRCLGEALKRILAAPPPRPNDPRSPEGRLERTKPIAT